MIIASPSRHHGSTLFLLSLLTLFCSPLHARTWNVGATRTYSLPSQVMSLVANGDTVLIDSGLYLKDCGVWRAKGLVLKCESGYAHLEAQSTAAVKKGIWVIDGDSAYVEGIEFSGCAISEADGSNGAGIRFESHILECRRCVFHDNQEGILTGNDTTNEIRIEGCEFDHNGVETGAAAGFQHNIYVGHSRLCRIAYCYFHRSIVGHEIKSRANRSYIFSNYIVDGPDGDGSYSIDLPNGGLGDIVGNIIEKGPNTQNSTVVTFGEEGLINPEKRFVFSHNTVVSDRTTTTFIRVADGTESALVANNIFAGATHLLVGVADTLNNVVRANVAFFNFRNAHDYDYHVTKPFEGYDSVAKLNELNDGVLLWPRREYSHPFDSSAERSVEPTYVGALAPLFEANVENSITRSQLKPYPNPVANEAFISLPTEIATGDATLALYDELGRFVPVSYSAADQRLFRFERGSLPSGEYSYSISTRSRCIATGRLIFR
jgi:hypothetical protein